MADGIYIVGAVPDLGSGEEQHDDSGLQDMTPATGRAVEDTSSIQTRCMAGRTMSAQNETTTCHDSDLHDTTPTTERAVVGSRLIAI
jgi:hypothetical protein